MGPGRANSPSRLRFEELDRLREHLFASWVTEPVDDVSEAGQDAADRNGITLVAVQIAGVFERLPSLLESASLLGSLRPALQQRRPFRIPVGAKVEGASELPLGLLDVE